MNDDDDYSIISRSCDEHDDSAASRTWDEKDPIVRADVERRRDGDYSKDELLLLLKWKTAPDYPNLIDLNRQFLRGELPFSATHLGPVWSETKPLLPGLLRLHDYGIFTIESQPYRNDGPTKTGCLGCDECNGLEWIQSQHRAFVSFILPQNSELITPTTLEAFLVELMVDEHFYVVIYLAKLEGSGCYPIPGVAGGFPLKLYTHITKRAKDKKGLKIAKANKSLHHHMNCACSLRNLKNKTSLMQVINPLLVHIVAKSWTEADLAGKIEEVAKRAGMERVFVK